MRSVWVGLKASLRADGENNSKRSSRDTNGMNSKPRWKCKAWAIARQKHHRRTQRTAAGERKQATTAGSGDDIKHIAHICLSVSLNKEKSQRNLFLRPVAPCDRRAGTHTHTCNAGRATNTTKRVEKLQQPFRCTDTPTNANESLEDGSPCMAAFRPNRKKECIRCTRQQQLNERVRGE